MKRKKRKRKNVKLRRKKRKPEVNLLKKLLCTIGLKEKVRKARRKAGLIVMLLMEVEVTNPVVEVMVKNVKNTLLVVRHQALVKSEEEASHGAKKVQRGKTNDQRRNRIKLSRREKA